MRQLDDGIGDTLVLVSAPPTPPPLQTGTVPGSTSYRDVETDSGALHSTGPNTKVSPIPSSN